MAFNYACLDASHSSWGMYRSTFSFSSTRFLGSFPMTFHDWGLRRSPHVKAPTISPSSFPMMSRVAFLNLTKYSLTITPSFCLHPMMEYEFPLYFCSWMKLVRKGYLCWLKLYMLPSRRVLKHVPALPSNIVRKYVHQNCSSGFNNVMVHSYLSMWLAKFVTQL